MNNTLLYVAIGIGVALIILIILVIAGKGDLLKKFLGPLGSLIIALVSLFQIKGGGGNEDLSKIKAENERIKAELDKLKKEADQLKATIAKERAEYELNLKNLQIKLKGNEEERIKLANQLKNTASKDPIAWLKSLPEAEQKKIVDEIKGGINWI